MVETNSLNNRVLCIATSLACDRRHLCPQMLGHAIQVQVETDEQRPANRAARQEKRDRKQLRRPVDEKANVCLAANERTVRATQMDHEIVIQAFYQKAIIQFCH